MCERDIVGGRETERERARKEEREKVGTHACELEKEKGPKREKERK